MRYATPLLLFVALAALAGLAPGCGCREGEKPRRLRVFHASGLTPVIEAVREDARRKLGIELVAETSGSQTACRKVTELGRGCDLLMLADNSLVTALLGGTASWRLDFATDEVVLAVGARAPEPDRAEEDWVSVLTAEGVRLGRVNENTGPIGYRTLLVWKLQEAQGAARLSECLRARCTRVVDHVSQLSPLLKTGEIDYAFVYRSLCIAHDIRHIRLDPAVNLGSPEVDYSGAVVRYRKRGLGGDETVTVTGAPVTWTLTVPDRGADAALAAEFARWLLKSKRDVLERHGFRPLSRPRFYGSAEAFAPFEEVAERTGELR